MKAGRFSAILGFLFAFPATESNDVVRPFHAKAVPVTLERL